jgi:hypothetical protein
VVADRWLGLAQAVAEIRDMQFTALREIDQNTQAGLVAHELEDLGEVSYCVVGDWREGNQRLVAVGFRAATGGRFPCHFWNSLSVEDETKES